MGNNMTSPIKPTKENLTWGISLLIIVFALLAASRFVLPVWGVLVSGSKHFSPKEVAHMSGISRGNPWLWASNASAKELNDSPWIAEARIVKHFPGQVEVKLVEREPVGTLLKSDGSRATIALDGTELPNGLNPNPTLTGWDSSKLPEALKIALLMKPFKPLELRFTPQGYRIQFKDLRIWTDSYASLLKWGGSVKILQADYKSAQINIYPWGVSVQQ
jgi:cell division protein FtsQ